MILNQAECYHSQVLKTSHAASEIWEPWVQWFQRLLHLNKLKCQGRHNGCQGPLKFSNGHCDLIPQQIVFILNLLNTRVPLIFFSKFQPNIPSDLEKMLILFALLFLVSAAILDSRPGWILPFRSPGVWSCCMWNFRFMDAVVEENKSSERT